MIHVNLCRAAGCGPPLCFECLQDLEYLRRQV